MKGCICKEIVAKRKGSLLRRGGRLSRRGELQISHKPDLGICLHHVL